MDTRLQFAILPQPDNFTCGPTCLQALFRYYGDSIGLQQVISEAPRLEDGGSLAVFLACDALRRGYRATIYTYNLQMFDPTWFAVGGVDIKAKLKAQAEEKRGSKFRKATDAYLEFIERGGDLRFEDLNPALIRKFLDRGHPILTGLSSTYLYRCAREYGDDESPDDVRGIPEGHFVVLYGYDRETKSVLVADPYERNPIHGSQLYPVRIDRVICAILLGVLTYDANLLIVQPPKEREGLHVDPGRR